MDSAKPVFAGSISSPVLHRKSTSPPRRSQKSGAQQEGRRISQETGAPAAQIADRKSMNTLQQVTLAPFDIEIRR